MAIYYCDYDNGADSNDGLSIANAFKNVPGTGTATSNASFTPANGDTIRLARGSVFLNTTRITYSNEGEDGNPVTYEAYDRDGETGQPNPVMSVWLTLLAADWEGTPQERSVWRVTALVDTEAGARNKRVFFNKVGQPRDATSIATVDAANPFWYDEVNDYLYVWSGSAVNNPSEVYDEVTAYFSDGTNRQFGFGSWTGSNITIKDITFRGANSYGAQLTHNSATLYVRNVSIINCTFDYNSGGIQFRSTTSPAPIVDSRTDFLIKGCTLTANWHPQEAISGEENSGDGVLVSNCISGLIVEQCVIDGFGHSQLNITSTTAGYARVHNVTFQDNFLTNPATGANYGRGFGINGTLDLVDGILIQRNYIYDTQTRNQIEGKNVQFINNIIDGVNKNTLPHAHSPEGTTDGLSCQCRITAQVENVTFANNVVMNVWGEALRIKGDETYIATGMKVYNNVFYKAVDGDKPNAVKVEMTASCDWEIHNNIIIKDGPQDDTFIVNTVETDFATAEADNSEIYSNSNADPDLDSYYFPALGSPCISAGATPLSEYDYHTRPSIGTGAHIGAKWPKLGGSSVRRKT